jgi:F-type H+-transporting ATPase subunit beta
MKKGTVKADTAKESTVKESTAKEGKIIQVIGPVIDVEFKEGELPTIYNAIRLTNPRINDKKENLVAEVAQHIGENTVRCVAMDHRWAGQGDEGR